MFLRDQGGWIDGAYGESAPGGRAVGDPSRAVGAERHCGAREGGTHAQDRGGGSVESKPDALPHDTYELEEFLCAVNKDKQLLSPIKVKVDHDAATMDLGTLKNNDLLLYRGL